MSTIPKRLQAVTEGLKTIEKTLDAIAQEAAKNHEKGLCYEIVDISCGVANAITQLNNLKSENYYRS